MDVTINKLILDANGKIIEDESGVLCEVENEAGDSSIIMVNRKELFQAGYEIPENNFNLCERGIEESTSCSGNDELDASTKSNVDEWSDESTRLLLDKYADYLKLVGPMKKFKNKKIMWIQIAKDLEAVLGIQKTYILCENRYKTILRRKRVSDKNNSTSGSKRVKVSFENEIKQIASKDDSIEPKVLQSANKFVVNVKSKVKSSSEAEISKIIKNKKTKSSLIETLVEIHKEKENKKQERHEEKMRLLKSFFEKENIHKDS
ncbi:uncharacterized protein LOC112466437 [Temnothorax curvispinosus]|uniref:Uncharacterized protein LOC112466437 n=1 Tax=Temnothorax curvispinosus TaxID=300111 RepID=A0A6J1R7V8_9HYME|nr:uncharacterized protein LOC112466437 [Temnothorax curvispinosus]